MPRMHRRADGRRGEAGDAVLVGDRGGAAGDGRRPPAGLGQGGEIAAQQAGRAGQGAYRPRGRPAAKIRPVGGIGAPGVGRLGGGGEAQRGGELGRGERAVEDGQPGGRDGQGACQSAGVDKAVVCHG
jgi:hypothetical protein